MAITQNDGLRNQEANDLGTVFDGGTLEIRTGTRPADPDSAATGTLLVTISIDNPAFGAASGGAISKAGDWSGTAVAAGVATWGRMKSAGGTETMDMDVGETIGNDAIISDENIAVDQEVTVSACTITIPDGV
jgi:hypothetical protein